MKSLRLISLSLLTILATLFYGCMDTEDPYDPYAQLAKEIKVIDDYLAENNITAVKDLRGVRMQITELGTGLPALLSNKVKVSYSGKVLDATTPFETGTATGMAVSKYIAGWQIALTTLPVGSKAKVYIPSPLAYGNQDQTKIPANSILVFDLFFEDVEETETEKQQFKSDTTAIGAYLTQKSIANVVRDTTGLRYVITTSGIGSKPTWYSPVKLKLVYKLLTDDSKVITTQDLAPSESYGSRVIDQINGLKVGLQQLEEGSKATFYIPSGLGYGPNPIGDASNAVLIPANSNLIIEAELIEVQ